MFIYFSCLGYTNANPVLLRSFRNSRNLVQLSMCIGVRRQWLNFRLWVSRNLAGNNLVEKECYC